MTALFAAFSLQDEIEKYGAYAGIAAIFGLGILSMLYFAQAREVKRLREWAGRAPERAAELEARVSADAQRRLTQPPASPAAPATPAAAQQAAAGAGPATPAAAGAGAATAAPPTTTAPTNGTGSGAAVPPPSTPAGQPGAPPPGQPGAKPAGQPGSTPGEAGPDAKPGDGAQAKPGEEAKPGAPATDAKPATPAVPGAKPETPASTPAGAAAAAASAATAPPAPGASTPPASGATAPAAPGAPTPPPPAPGDTEDSGELAAVGPTPPPRAAPLRAPTASTSIPPRTPAGARPRTADEGRSPGRLAAIVGAVLGVVAVIAVAAILIFGGGDGDNPKPEPNKVVAPGQSGSSGGSKSSSSTKKPATAAVNRGQVTIAVLNGTTVTGLARSAADRVLNKGYREGTVTNDPNDQSRQVTQVFYEPSAKAAALDVAKILGVQTGNVKPMDANTRVVADRAQVAVLVGADKAQ